jgi:hypothetical protein
MGQSKPHVAGFTMEAPSSRDFVAQQPHNGTGVTMVWAVKAGFGASSEATAGAQLCAKMEKHPGTGQVMNMGQLFVATGVEALMRGETVLDPAGVSVSLCAWNPAHNMFNSDKAAADSSDTEVGTMTPAELEAAETSRYVLVVHVPQDSKPGCMYDALLARGHNEDDHTVQWDEGMRSLMSAKVEKGTGACVMSYAQALGERFHSIQRKLQYILAQQMASHLQSDTGPGDMQLELLGDARRPLGVVHTDGWTHFVATSAAQGAAAHARPHKAVYCSNTITVKQGHGVVPVFKGPGRGFHMLSSGVRAAESGANAVEDTKIVPATAGRLVAPDDALFISRYGDERWAGAIRDDLQSRSQIYFTKTRRAHDLSRELLCYTSPEKANHAYNGRSALDPALQKYAGTHCATPALHVATVVM